MSLQLLLLNIQYCFRISLVNHVIFQLEYYLQDLFVSSKSILYIQCFCPREKIFNTILNIQYHKKKLIFSFYCFRIAFVNPVIAGEASNLNTICRLFVSSQSILYICLLYTSPSPRDKRQSRMPSSA